MPWKNSTRVTVPLLSAAVTEITTLAGATYDAPLAGALTAVDVPVAPALSVARAVRLYVPAATFCHVNE